MNSAASQNAIKLDHGVFTALGESAELRRLKPCAAALAAVAAVLSVGFPLYVMTGERERVVSFVSDDAYYYFQVAENIARGHGPTTDGLTKTTGFHPLYGFLLAGIHRLASPSIDGFVRWAIALNTVCLLLAGWFLYLAAEVWWGRIAAGLATLLWLTNPHAALVNVIGLEGSVYAMTLALLLWRLAVFTAASNATCPRAVWLTQAALIGACAGLTVLSRTDALLFVAMALPVILSAGWRKSASVAVLGAGLALAIGIGLLSLWWWYAWRQTGAMVQGSASVKTLWRPELVEEDYGSYSLWTSLLYGAGIWLSYLAKCFLKVPALKWSVSATPGLFSRAAKSSSRGLLLHACWLFPALAGAAYAMLIDRPRTWYYISALILLTFIAAGAAAKIIREPATNSLFSRAKKWLPVLAWLVVVECAAIGARNIIYGRSSDQVIGLRAAEWVRDNIETDAVIGCWHSGIVQYYTSNHTVINLDGLANNEILSILRGEKTMNEYWDERGISIILGLPRQKMGGFSYQWNGKKLSPVREGVLRVVTDPDATSNE